MIDLPSWYLPCASGLVAGVALGWVFGRGHTALERRYVRHLEWALAVTEGVVAGHRRAAARLASLMAGRAFAHSEHAIASAPVPAVYLPALRRWGGPLAPDPQVYDHTLRTPASRIYIGAGIDAATRIVNDVLNDLGPPPGWRPQSLADLEPDPSPVPRRRDPDRPEHRERWYARALRQLAGWWATVRGDVAGWLESVRADRSPTWMPGELVGKHRAEGEAERRSAAAPKHVQPLTMPYPMPRSCTP